MTWFIQHCRSIILAAVALAAWSVLPARAQMPPHPQLLARIQRGEISLPYVLAHISELRRQGMDAPWSTATSDKKAALRGTAPLRSLGPASVPSGSWRALVILVQFSDQPAQVRAASFDSLMFGAAPGSVRDYYKKVSYGSLDIVTANLPSQMGWATAPEPYAYYVNGQNGMGAYPQNAQKLVEDAVDAVDSVVDFSQYDNDHDGYVDALFIVHTGPGAEFSGSNNDIWSHSSTTHAPMLHDGVYVYRYSTEPEFWLHPGDITIGVFAHELGHAAFGLPDLYDVDYSSKGIGLWSLMSYGSWNGKVSAGDSPALPDAMCHIQMGYVSPVTIAANTPGLQLHDVETNPEVYRLWSNGNHGKEYFLVENRQRTGFDAPLPGSGLLVYHIDEAVTSENEQEWYPGHTDAGHYLAALEQADGLWELEKGINGGNAGDPYPGTSNNRTFSSASSPDSRAYSFALTGVALRNISASAPTMTADVEVTEADTLITLTAPNGNERWQAGTVHDITWYASHIDAVDIDYSSDGGSHWSRIATGAAAASGKFTWNTPLLASPACLVRLSNSIAPAVSDISDREFSICSGATAETEPNNTAAQANFIIYGDTLDASIGTSDDVDYYAFPAAASDTVVISAQDRGASALDGAIRLYAGDGSLVAFNDDYGSSLQSRLVYRVPTGGVYYIRFAYYNTGGPFPGSPAAKSLAGSPGRVNQILATSGDYRITINRFTPAPPDVFWPYATNLSWDHVTLMGSVAPNGPGASVSFEYGTSTAYGHAIAADQNPLSGTDLFSVSTSKVLGLSPNTVYHFRVVATSGAGMTRSDDNIFSTPASPDGWAAMSSGTVQSLTDVTFPTAITGTAVGSAGCIYRSVDGGFSWVAQQSGTGVALYGVAFETPNHGIAVGETGTIVQTTDGGSHWVASNSPTLSSFLHVAFAGASTAIAVGPGGTIGRTTDGGTHWALQYGGTLQGLMGIAFGSPTQGIAVGQAGTVLFTTDAGLTWNAAASITSSSLHSVCFADPTTAIAVGDGGTVIRSSDGGTTWKPAGSGTSANLQGIACAGPYQALAVGDAGTIISSSDGGDTWQKVNSGTLNSLMAAALPGPADGAVVGENGTILHTNVPLIVQLESFAALRSEGGLVQLTWRTASETNNYGFQVQRSASPGSPFLDIAGAFIAGHGTSVGEHSYAYVDTDGVPADPSYRLKQIELDGSSNYSESIGVGAATQVHDQPLPGGYGLSQNYPNPFNPSTRIPFMLPHESRVRLDVFNMLGERVATIIDGLRPAGFYEERFDASRLPSGVYLYRIQAGDFVKTMKLIVLK